MKQFNFDKVFEKIDEAFTQVGEAFETLGTAFESVEVEDTLTIDDITVKIIQGRVRITGAVKSITLNGNKLNLDKNKES